MCKQVEHGDISSNHRIINIKYDKISRYRKCCVQMRVLCANDSIVCK